MYRDFHSLVSISGYLTIVADGAHALVITRHDYTICVSPGAALPCYSEELERTSMYQASKNAILERKESESFLPVRVPIAFVLLRIGRAFPNRVDVACKWYVL